MDEDELREQRQDEGQSDVTSSTLPYEEQAWTVESLD